ncbi:DoxX-like family protein [Promicromonospora umidemergens]|uniref:DoxX family protein n=1 Tax=Promicromonospora umidemergens TaxID=629679 RepID=A0ABP8X1X9_9MICO|nr:DoxX family protein [Promicromonospora umidemergens]MCP2285061.1 DoxX-like family protein [Promicromonospora umidemergens]
MNIALWIAAGLLSIVYVGSGGLKVIASKERIAATGAAAGWVEDFKPRSIKAIGVLEVLGGLGLVLPAALGIAPDLVPLSALGLAMIMVGAAVTRISRGEYKLALVDLTYLALIGFVVWGRFGPEAFVG